MEDLIECEVCELKFKVISPTHVKNHGMTMATYRAAYPTAKLKNQRLTFCTPNRESFWTERHGEAEGKRKYKEYKKFLGYKNTLPYKQEKNGWSIEDFNAYNKTRAITLENLIHKNGNIVGTKKYNAYVAKQRYAGCKEEYFIGKYGHTEGKRIYLEVNKRKAHNLKNYERLYGKENAEQKLSDFFTVTTAGPYFSSKIEWEFISGLLSKIDVREGVYYYNPTDTANDKQFGMWSHVLDKYIMFDFVLLSSKKCIEFYGDYWHCNPLIYNEDFIHTIIQKTAKDIWQIDQIKREEAKNVAGLDTYVVWEKEYNNDKTKCIEETIKWLTQ